MQYTVFLQNSKDGMYLARASSWTECVGKGRTRDEALENIRKALEEMLENVVEITQVEVDVPKMRYSKPDPWLESRGMFADVLVFDDFLLEIEAYRKEIDNG